MLQVFIAASLAFLLASQDSGDPTAVLMSIHARYLAADKARDVAALVKLDSELRELFEYRQHRRSYDERYFLDEYFVLGISVGHYSQALNYNGSVLGDAHGINPNSPLRNYTLYSTTGADTEYDPPDMGASGQYLREFPNGPFAADVHLAMAQFHDDLYKFLKARSAHQLEDHDCYAQFVTAAPLTKQMAAARTTALEHYRAYRRLRPSDQFVTELFDNLLKHPGSMWQMSTWFYCGD